MPKNKAIKKKTSKKTSKLSFNIKQINFLTKLINTPSPTGFEYTGQKVWIDYIKPYVDDVRTDTYGTAVAVINPDADYKVVLEAHCDEISRFVNYITDQGQIHVIRNGGSDHMIAPSKRVHIWTDNGPIDAVFGRPAIHTRKASKGIEEQPPKIQNITLDCGCSSKAEVEKLGVHVGCVITYQDEFMMLNQQYFVGRGLDNRIGGFTIAQVARLFHQNKTKLPFGLYIVNAVQEEIGLKGAQMIAERIQPDMAIVTDVCHDTSTPMIKPAIEGDIQCGQGPVLTYAPSIHNQVLAHVIDVATKHEIPFQRLACSRTSGTDTDSFAYSNQGVPSVLISFPTRYMHTTVEMVHQSDVAQAIQLIQKTLLGLTGGESWKYHNC